MLNILAKRHGSTLADFASSNVVVAFDYDGTLASITTDPKHARLRPKTRRLLRAVARRYPCVVISGRGQRDVARRLAGIPLWYVLGNHGLEPWGQQAADTVRVREWLERLERRLEPYRGLSIEDKTYSVTIHYRQVRQKRRALKAIRAAVRALRGSRALGGNQAVNLVLRDAPTKGAALEHARRLLARDGAIYVGDDETDEDAFVAAPADRLLSIRIGVKRTSRARYYLKTQQDIDTLLERLLVLRSGQPARVDGPMARRSRSVGHAAPWR